MYKHQHVQGVKAEVVYCLAKELEAEASAVGYRGRAARVKSHDGIGWSQGQVQGNALSCWSLWEKNLNFIKSNQVAGGMSQDPDVCGEKAFVIFVSSVYV